jgi:HrpA-like RNA helicase
MAAITLATRASEELGTLLGEEVGYAVRFDSKISARTCVRYVTDGLLLRYLLADPLLFAYSKCRHNHYMLYTLCVVIIVCL